MELNRISHSCEFVKVYSPAVTTIIGLVSDILFSLVAVGRRYMEFFPMYVMPESLSLFSIFLVGVTYF